jgi:hypothetical protein
MEAFLFFSTAASGLRVKTGGVPVAVGRTAVFGVVIPRATAQHLVVPVPSSLPCQDKSGEYLLSELPGIAVPEVGFPALYGVDDICQFNLTFGVISLQLPESPPRSS